MAEGHARAAAARGVPPRNARAQADWLRARELCASRPGGIGCARVCVWPLVRGRACRLACKVGNMSQPVVAIGLDAAEPSLIEKWMDQGKLPFLAGLRASGVYGRLANFEYCRAEAACTSFLTG